MSGALTVLDPGVLTLVEDLGRPGLAGVGVGRSGAADRGALRQANRLLGNPEDAAALETVGGLEVRVDGQPVWCCLTGSPADLVVDGRAVGSHGVVRVPARARVRVGRPRGGLRSYLAVRGGIAVGAVLGSRSRDVLADLGPAPLAEGDRLPVGADVGRLPDVAAVAPPALVAPGTDVVALRTVRGPRDDRLADPAALVGTTWEVSERSNRVGARLSGPPLRFSAHAEMPTEGAWRGAVQVPPGGRPVLFLADHPVSGGYPVVAVVVDADVDRAAQLAPGRRVRFRWVPAPW